MTTTTDYVALGSVYNPEATSIQDDVTSLASSGSVSGTSSTGDCDSVLNSSVHSLSDDDQPTAMTSERNYTKPDIPAEAETQKESENGDARRWRTVKVMEEQHRIDMSAIDPFKNVISHGGKKTLLHGVIIACFYY